MQPYQEATEEIRRQGELPLKLAKKAATVGSALASAGGAAYLAGGSINRVVPFLSKYVPEDLAIKGLSKIDPRYGNFIQKAMSAGKSFEEVKEFIGDKIEEGSEISKPASQEKNIIEQYSPDLHRFLMEEIQNGRSPIEAGAIASLGKKGGPDFKSIISKITKDHKTPWSAILESVYGGQGKQKSQNPQQQQPNQVGQAGPGQQALMDVLSRINQKLGS